MVFLLWIFYVISVLFLLCFCARLFIEAMWSPAGKGLTSWLSFVMSNCEVVTFPLVDTDGKVTTSQLGQVWCLIVSIPDLCPFSYFQFAGVQFLSFSLVCMGFVRKKFLIWVKTAETPYRCARKCFHHC